MVFVTTEILLLLVSVFMPSQLEYNRHKHKDKEKKKGYYMHLFVSKLKPRLFSECLFCWSGLGFMSASRGY